MSSISTIWVREVVRDLEQRDIKTSDVLATARLTPAVVDDDNGWIPFNKHVEVFEAAAQATGDFLFGAKLGRTIDVRTAGFIMYSGLAADTLEQALHNFARYQSLTNRADVMYVRRCADGQCSIRTVAANNAAVQANMFNDGLTLNVFNQLAGTETTPALIRMPYIRPKKKEADAIEQFFKCRVEFTGAWDVVYDAADMQRPVVTRDPHLVKLVHQYGARVLTELQTHVASLEDEIRSAVIKRLPSQSVTTDAIAEAIGIAPHTLRRRVAEHGTSVKAIVDATRARLTQQYQASGKFKRKEIAYLTGYRSYESFAVARKRWQQASQIDKQ